jgi:release factor glutamine methyltransferase
MSREDLLLAFDDMVSCEAQMRIEGLTARRITGEPMAYIRGVKEFWSLTFKVDGRVMIPRPDTEVLVERCLRHAGERLGGSSIVAVDVGTGSGAIACALACELEGALVAAVDISKEAVGLARENIETLGLSPRVRPVAGDLLGPFRRRADFHIVAANLPYIPSAEIGFLPEGTRNYEPRVALDGGGDGLAVMRRLLHDADEYIQSGGLLALEVDDGQVEEVMSVVKGCPAYGDSGVDIDTAGFKRVAWAVKK